uniref:V-type proton ATPase subunit S1/VOA1 transmembrane domain-containing protein n=1 Tax=Parascaris univalens TaxID=6257 RepID=A0A915AXU6_PARUN
MMFAAMSLICALFGLIVSGTNAAFDSILWSSLPLDGKSVEDIVASSSVSSPVVIYALTDFTLATFTHQANAFDSKPNDSPLISQIRQAEHHKAQSVDNILQISPDAVVHRIDDVVGKPLAVFQVQSWQELENLAPQVEQHLKEPFVSIISSGAAFSTKPVEKRQKRVSVSSDVNFGDEEQPPEEHRRPTGKSKPSKPFQATRAVELQMPVVLPPVNISGGGFVPTPNDLCLFYLEAINVVVMRGSTAGTAVFRNVIVDGANGTNTFNWDPSYVNCAVSNMTVGVAKFTVSVNVKTDMVAYYEQTAVFIIRAGQTIAFELTFNGSYTGYWNLVHLAMLEPLTISNVANGVFLSGDIILPANSNTSSTRYMGVESFFQYAYACSGTQAAFMNVGENLMVGIALNNVEVDLKAYYGANGRFLAFNRDVYDCVGSFSVGSWMGIICSLVLASILMFGYLMLQSVQTMDRFDDPKQKQIVINFKE